MKIFKKSLNKSYILPFIFSLLFPTFLLANNNEKVESKNTEKKFAEKIWQDLDSKKISNIENIFKLIEQKEFSKAQELIGNIKDEEVAFEAINPGYNQSLKNILLWKKFSTEDEEELKKISFNDISRFVAENPYFPNIDQLKENVEKVAIFNNILYSEAKYYFEKNPAKTKKSKLYLTDAKIEHLNNLNLNDEARRKESLEVKKSISEIWIKENFSNEEEIEFLTKYEDQLTNQDYIDRIERLLWNNKQSDAKRIISLLDNDHRRLYEAIMEFDESPRYIDKIIFSVPRYLRGNELLSYKKVIWYRSKNKIEDLLEVLASLPQNSKYASNWYGLKILYARELLKEKRYKLSYKIISSHGLKSDHKDYWEAEWTSGWISLRFLEKPKIAYLHFQNLYQNVVQPVTIARASYWLGMASLADEKEVQAMDWFKVASKYPTFFYGQLAIHKRRTIDPIGTSSEIILPKNPDISGRDIIKISNSQAAQIAYILSLVKERSDSEKIFKWIVKNSPTDGQIAVIMKLVSDLNDRELDVKISKEASKKNVFFIKDKFQIIKEVKEDQYSPLVHAIIKQESGFVPSAVSRVGAIGFMQLMPETAKLVSKEVGVKYSKWSLARDIKYNIKLGSHYIKKLIDRFDGSEMLAIASYNAGPNNAQRWINEFYDPRKADNIDEVVDWIELITYSETRNYVQRIMENLIVYKYLMSRTNYDDIK